MSLATSSRTPDDQRSEASEGLFITGTARWADLDNESTPSYVGEPLLRLRCGRLTQRWVSGATLFWPKIGDIGWGRVKSARVSKDNHDR